MAYVLARDPIQPGHAGPGSGTGTGPGSGPDPDDTDFPEKPIDDDDGLGLGDPRAERRFFFQRGPAYDPDAVATQRSVYDDPRTAPYYAPRADWENGHRFDPAARWTWREERAVVRQIDWRIFAFCCFMLMALELDRSNIQQAVSGSFLKDLRLTTNDYNLGNTVFSISFLLAEVPSQLVSKWVGPDRWIPFQIVAWSVVALSQFWLSGRRSFLACRALLGILQGGFIPDMVLYLSYFYKHHELALRFGIFWTARSFADILMAFIAFGVLRIHGHGAAGWRWLFLIEGCFSACVGIAAIFLMPPSPTQTASWARGKKGWFTEREEIIMVNRIIREDPSKGGMHNRQAISPKQLWHSLTDYDLWPLYAIGLTFQVPMTTPQQYLTQSLKGLGFDTFQTNLLVIPSSVIHIVLMLALTYTAEVTGALTLSAVTGQIWALPFIVYLYCVDIKSISRWKAWGIMTLLVGYPSAHPMHVGWTSRNANTVRSRSVSAALYNMFCQLSGVISSNIYRKDDAPRYKNGDRVLVGLVCMNIAIYALTKTYYVLRNRYRDRKWSAMTEQQRTHYIATTADEGSKRLEFRFAH